MPERFRVVCIPYKALYKCWDLPLPLPYYKSDKMVNFCGFRCATTSPITFFINFVFTFIFDVFIPIYAEIRCLPLSVTYQWHSSSRFNCNFTVYKIVG